MSDARSVMLATEDEYLTAEFSVEHRHEYVDGVVRAMTGASIRHNAIAGNLFTALRSLAKGSNCRVTIEGVRLRVNARRHYYPDVMVSCEEPGDAYAMTAPCLIAEVLSPTTSAVDRGEKRIAYMAMPSLRHLLLIDIEGQLIDHTWRTGADDPWRLELGTPGGTLHLQCPAVAEIFVDEIFADD